LRLPLQPRRSARKAPTKLGEVTATIPITLDPEILNAAPYAGRLGIIAEANLVQAQSPNTVPTPESQGVVLISEETCGDSIRRQAELDVSHTVPFTGQVIDTRRPERRKTSREVRELLNRRHFERIPHNLPNRRWSPAKRNSLRTTPGSKEKRRNVLIDRKDGFSDAYLSTGTSPSVTASPNWTTQPLASGVTNESVTFT
jgi:hypothetical protein